MVWVISGSETTRGVAGVSAGTGDGVWTITHGDLGLGETGEEAATGVGGEGTLTTVGSPAGTEASVIRLIGSRLGGMGDGLLGKPETNGSVVGTEGSTMILGDSGSRLGTSSTIGIRMTRRAGTGVGASTCTTFSSPWLMLRAAKLRRLLNVCVELETRGASTV